MSDKRKGPRVRERSLSDKEVIFCGAYAISGNAQQAALLAGYSVHFATKKAYKLPLKPKLAACIEDLRRKKMALVEKTVLGNAQTVVSHLAMIATADPISYLRQLQDGRYIRKAPHDLEPYQRAAVKKVVLRDIREDGVLVGQDYDYILYDKMDALCHLGNHFGVFAKQGPEGLSLDDFADMPTETLEELSATIRRAIDGKFENMREIPAENVEVNGNATLLPDG